MKKGFKRFLSSVLATVMAVAGMTIGMATTASAATTTSYYLPAESITEGFTASGTGTSGNLASSFSFAGEADTHSTSTSAKAAKLDSKGSVAFSVNGNAEVEIVWSIRTDKTASGGILVDGTAVSEAPSITDYVHSIVSLGAGDHKITRASGNEARIYGIKVVDVVSDDAKTYTISGTCNLTDTTFTLGDMDATVDASGNWTVSKTAVSAPFAEGDTLAVSKSEYDASPASVTLAAGDSETSFTGGNITFTKKVLSALSAGSYLPADIEAGLPNFENTGLTISGTGKYKGETKIILSDTATVTVNAKSGSSDSTKAVALAIGETSYDLSSTAGGSATDFVFTNVPAGETIIKFDTSATTVQVVSITITYGATETSSEVSTETSTETTTEGQTEATTEVVPAGAISDKATLTFDSVVGTVTTTDDVVVGDFTIIAGSSSAIDSNNFTFDGLGKYTSRYKTGGKATLTNGVPTNRAIKFATAGAGVVQIAARGSGNSARAISVYSSDGTVLGTASSTNQEGVILTAKLPSAGTYYIASPDNGFAIYSVNVVVNEVISDGANNGKVFTDSTDAYIIVGVTAAEVADTNNSEVSVSVNDKTPVTSGEVYKAAIIDGQYVTAEELGYDFIYVVKAVGAVLDNVKGFVVSFISAS